MFPKEHFSKSQERHLASVESDKCSCRNISPECQCGEQARGRHYPSLAVVTAAMFLQEHWERFSSATRQWLGDYEKSRMFLKEHSHETHENLGRVSGQMFLQEHC